MTQPTNPQPPRPQTDYLRALISTIKNRPGLIVVPVFSALLIAVLMALLGPKTWDATQSFVVREQLIGRIVGPGRFDSLDAMKTAQEVIQETARRPVVLRRVLADIGKVNASADDIESLRDAVSFHAPGGAELGKTEILTMRIKSSSADRATELVNSLFEETRREIRTIRQRKAESMMDEIGQAIVLAQERLGRTSERIRVMERRAGGDLSELRSLTEPSSGASELRRSMGSIQTELRQARLERQQAEQLIQYLEEVSGDPEQLLATPRELLEAQPALSELKNKLIEAQVVRSNTGGIYSPRHPQFQARANSVVDIEQQINRELGTALTGLRSQHELAKQRVSMLVNRTKDIENRVSDLAAMRVDYAQLVTELGLRNEELKEAHKEQAQVEAILRGSDKVDYMSRLDEAQAGIRPLGPSGKTLVMGALVAGLFIGMGLVMMVTPSPNLFPPSGGNGSYVSPGSPDTPAMGGVTTIQPAGIPGFVIPDVGPAPFPGQTSV